MDDYIVVPLKTAISLLHEQRFTNPMIAKKLGVTPLQVHYYHSGKTKEPKAKVCMKLFEEFRHEGKNILVNLYKTYEELEHHYNISKD